MIRDMWNIGINILQANQAEIGPAQLNDLTKNVIGTSDADFKRFKAALGALAAHEVTDLMGAANPFLPVLPPPVIEGYFSTYRKLLSGIEEMRARVLASTEKLDPAVEARTLYRTLLPEMPVDENGNDVKSKEVKQVLKDIPDPIFLVKRLAQNLRMKPLTATDVDTLLVSLDQVRLRDKQAYADLANQLGRDNQPLFHYYLPQLAESVLKELKRTPESFVLALQTMGRVIGYTNKIVKEQGGPDAFVAKHYVPSYDLRKVCIGVISEITTASANLKDFDPAALQFTGVQKIDVVGSEKSTTTTLNKMFGPKDGPSYEQIGGALKKLPSNVSLFLGKEALRSLKGDERAVVLDEIGTLVKSINHAYKERDGVADWAPETIEKCLLVVTQLYLLGRARLLNDEKGPYHIDLHTIIDRLKDPSSLAILDHKMSVRNRVAEPVASMSVGVEPLKLMASLADMPGKQPLTITSGGSGSILAASVGHLLDQAGKSTAGLVSVRYDKIGSVGKNDTRLASRLEPTNSLHVGAADSNVHQVFPTSTSNGRFVESRASQDFKTFLVVDNDPTKVADQIRAAMNALPEKPDSVIYLSMGGSVTYSEATAKTRQVFSPSDQHVMSALDTLSQDSNPVPISLLSMMNGLDAPKDMNRILSSGNWQYLPFDDEMTKQLLEFDNSLNIADDDEAEYGTTRSSLRLALDGKFGIQALPLPSRVVLDDASVWNFVKFIDPSMRGMTYTDFGSHRDGLENYEKGVSSSSEAPIEQL